MFDDMRMMLSRVDADYADIRYEIKKETIIQYDGKELTRIGLNSTDGYVLRVLKDGGLASASFTKTDDAEQAVRTAVENAGLIARYIDKPIRLAGFEAVKDTFQPAMNEDPRNVSMMEKLELIRQYNEIPFQHEKIVTTKVRYTELMRERYFLSSAGSEIREDLITTQLGGLIISKDVNITQNISVIFGGSDGFTNIRNQEANFEQRTAIALDLLNAKPVEGGVYNVILNPEMTGVFTHEAFGHLSEADIIETLPATREKMQIGSKLGNDVLTIIDDATQPHQIGFYKYDDEGVPVRPVT